MYGFLNAGAPQPSAPQPGATPWGGLPTATQPWSASSQAPWRMSPWQTQGMPSGHAVPPADAPPPQQLQQPSAPNLGGDLLSTGSSSDIPNFQPELAPPRQTAPQQAPMLMPPPAPRLPNIMDHRTWSAMSMDDNMGYGAYVGDTLAAAQPSLYQQSRNRNKAVAARRANFNPFGR